MIKVFAETPRLILREILPSDVDGMFELDSNPAVHRYLGNKPVTSKEEIIQVIQYIRQQYADYGIGRWAIIDKNSHEFMGWTGLKLVTEPTNNHQNYYDIGYRLIPKYWGKGIATESAMASLEYAFKELHLNEVYAAANIENHASNKILKRLGMQFIETFYYHEIACNWYKIEMHEYQR
jgi:RimJ/RimL family protein N-acetyltransferase